MVTIGAGANPTVKEEEPIHKPALKDFHRWREDGGVKKAEKSGSTMCPRSSPKVCKAP